MDIVTCQVHPALVKRVSSLPGAKVVCCRPHLAGMRQYISCTDRPMVPENNVPIAYHCFDVLSISALSARSYKEIHLHELYIRDYKLLDQAMIWIA